MSAALSDPLTLPCGFRLKNRIAKAAMTEGLADAANRATPRLAALYRRWAEGGAGLLITGNVMVDRRFLERPGNVAIDGPQTDDRRRALEAWAKAATGAGAAIFMQLSHAGRQTPVYVAAEPVGPSAVPMKLPGGTFGPPRALDAAEIEEVIARFAAAAATAKSCGFSGVQIHAAHGYLVSEFLSPIANRRDDEWGGPLENRARLLIRIVRAVRGQVGSGFPVSVKLNSSDFQKGGFAFEDCLTVAEWLEAEGVDLLEISGGSYEQPAMMGMDGALEPSVEPARRPSTVAREAYFLDFAAMLAGELLTPLMVTGGFRSRTAMGEALRAGAADVIGLARPFCVVPDIAAQLISGAIERAPAPENSLRLGGGVFGPNSPSVIIRAVNGFGVMAFFYENIVRLAEGREARPRAAILPAFIRHQTAERRAARALERADGRGRGH